MSRHACYALVNTKDRRTYVGYTTDPDRRLRQHNGELTGGAWSTARSNRRAGTPRSGAWRFLFIVACEEPATTSGTTNSGASASHYHEPWTSTRGLSLEWHLKRRRGVARGRRPSRRRHSSSNKGRGSKAQPKSEAPPPSPATLRGVPLRIACLLDALTHPKFRTFASRFVVLAADDVIDHVWAAFAGVPSWNGTPCIVPMPPPESGPASD